MYSSAKVNGFSFKVWFGKFEPAVMLKELEIENDIVLFGFNAFDEIDLSKEIMGEESNIKLISDYSATISAAVFCGIKTYIMDIKNIGVCVCNKGNLVDIVDRVANPFDDEYGKTNKLKIISTKRGKIALLIDTDCMIDEHWKKIQKEADIVVCISDDNSMVLAEQVKMYSAIYSKPYIYVNAIGVEWKE